MLHQHTLEQIRRMTPDEKIQAWMSLMRFSRPFWDLPNPAIGDRKWALWRQEHDLSNENVLRALRERGLRAFLRTISTSRGEA